MAGASGAGGVVVEVTLTDEGDRLLEERPGVPLPRDLPSGESEELEIELRRPLGPARLHLEPHVVGNRAFRDLGGPRWESEI